MYICVVTFSLLFFDDTSNVMAYYDKVDEIVYENVDKDDCKKIDKDFTTLNSDDVVITRYMLNSNYKGMNHDLKN